MSGRKTTLVKDPTNTRQVYASADRPNRGECDEVTP